MMLEPGLEQETFKTFLEKCRTREASSDGLERMRQRAWQHFLALGLPTKRCEAYRYIKLRQLFSQFFQTAPQTPLTRSQIAPWIYPECKNSVLVFINGYFHPQLSQIEALPSKVLVSTIEEALPTFGAFLNNQWTKSLQDETDPFAVLNAALHREAAFLYVPPKCQVEIPIQVLHLIDTPGQLCMLMPRLQVFIGAHAKLHVVQTQKHLCDQSYFVNMSTEWAVEEGACGHYTQALCNEHPLSWHFDTFRATLKRDSQLTTLCATQGSLTVRNDYRITLSGENAEALLNGVWMLSNKQEFHSHVLIDHQAPHCRSFQLFKGALTGFSRSSFEGKIMVRQAAQKTEAFQLNNNLILSDHAHADSKPNLEIFADDVKASHGATVGQLDPEQLFYMKTRGFTEAEAKNLLVYGFCEQVIEKITLSSLREELSTQAKTYLKPSSP